MSDRIEAHYASADIAARILAALRAAHGADVAVTPDALAPLDHFHGRGLPATRELARLLDPRPGERVLDIGSGIGGPARWIAAHYRCHVTGIDLTQEFCRAAEALNRAAGLSDHVRIVHGSALAIPLPDASFDRAYSHNVIMNIADKPGFYREAWRVLRPGGMLALANLCAGANGEPYYPAPWAASAATSFLATPDATRRDLEAVGFDIASFRDTTADAIAAQETMRKRIEAEGPPALGMHVLMGERFAAYQANTARATAEGRLVSVEILARKLDLTPPPRPGSPRPRGTAPG
jgi:sarcosine/dimethylglycine N-methyltransferase